MKLSVYLMTLLLDNTYTNRWTQISEDLKC